MSYQKIPQEEVMVVATETHSTIQVTEVRPVAPPPPPPQVGPFAVIPDNDIAKLMYYMYCVHKCIRVNCSARLLDFQNYRLLNETERRDLVILAHRFRPSTLRHVIFFEVDDNNYMLPTHSNTFLAFDDPVVIGSFHLPSNAVTVEGVHTVIHHIMIHKAVWIQHNFDGPYTNEKWRIGLAPKPRYYTRTSSTYSPATAIDVPLWCAGGVLCCFILPPVGLAMLIIGGCRGVCESARASTAKSKSTTYVVY